MNPGDLIITEVQANAQTVIDFCITDGVACWWWTSSKNDKDVSQSPGIVTSVSHDVRYGLDVKTQGLEATNETQLVYVVFPNCIGWINQTVAVRVP